MDAVVMGIMLVSVIVTFAATVVVFVSRPLTATHIYLSVFLLSIGVWALTAGVAQPAFPAEVNLVLGRFAFLAAICLSYALYRFACTVAAHQYPHLSKLLLGLSVTLGLLSMTPLVLSRVISNEPAIIFQRQPLYYLVISLICAQLVAGLTILYAHYREVGTSRAKKRAFIIFCGSLLGVVVGVMSNVVLANLLPSWQSSRWAWVATTIWTVTLAYTVIRRGFLGIRLALIRSAAYIVAILTVTALYYLIAAGVSSVVGVAIRLTGFELVANVALIILISLLFGPLRRFFDRVTDRIFYRDRYDSQAILDRVSALCVEQSDLTTLTTAVLQTLESALHPEYLAVVFDSERIDTIAIGKSPRTLPALRDLKRGHLGSGGGQVLQLETPSQHIGCLLLGERLNSSRYLREDMRMLAVVTDELSIAVQNIFRLEEIRSFARTLETEVSDATKELRASNKKLLEMDATKDEFVSMASHQLRTPLTSIKGYLSMVLEGDAGEISPVQRKLLMEAFVSSERMVHLIGDFLNVSRLQTGKFMVERRECNLAKIVEQEVDGIKKIAASHSIVIAYRKPARFPILYLDEGKMRQVIMNFIDNAIYYSPEGSTIVIRLKVEAGAAVLTVKDSGMGVPRSEQKHLFTKFFRAENARKQRPDGTGIGLFLAKKVVDAHGGALVFESLPGKGSTFGFSLPIKKLSSAPPVETSHQPKNHPSN